MKKTTALAIVLAALLSVDGSIARGQSSIPGHEPKRLFAAVLLVRGSVSGANVGNFGVFVRDEGDSTWTKVSRSNTMSFGLGYFELNATRRYYVAAGNGLHRSTDGGKSWRILTSWKTMEILNVAADPVDSATMYVATPYGVFKSIDDGATWNGKANGLKKWYVQRVIMDETDRRVLYAECEDDLYRSMDGGEEWMPLNVGAAPILAVLQHPSDPSTLLAGVEDGGIRYTTNGGRSWQAGRGLEGTSIYALRASADGKDIYAGGWHTGLWRSEDVGKTWVQVWSDTTVEAVYSILVDPENPDHVLVGTAGAGLFETTDRGRIWTHAGLPGAQVKQIEIYP